MKNKSLEMIILQGAGRGERYPLSLPHLILGRNDTPHEPDPNAIFFSDATVSRLHATLDWDQKARRYIITHRSSTNATLVNGNKITSPVHLFPGDKIQLGHLLLELRVGIGQHADLHLDTVDFAALTKLAARQVYHPHHLQPEAPVTPDIIPADSLEEVGPIPDPIPPPVKPHWPVPDFNRVYAPIVSLITPAATTPAATTPAVAAMTTDVEEHPVLPAPRRISLQGTASPQPDLPETEKTADSDKTLPETMINKPIRRTKPKVGRNQKCPCGSGKKYKKCCGRCREAAINK